MVPLCAFNPAFPKTQHSPQLHPNSPQKQEVNKAAAKMMPSSLAVEVSLMCSFIWWSSMTEIWKEEKKACCGAVLETWRKLVQSWSKNQPTNQPTFFCYRRIKTSTLQFCLSWMTHQGKKRNYSPCSAFQILEDCKGVNKQPNMPPHGSFSRSDGPKSVFKSWSEPLGGLVSISPCEMQGDNLFS